VNDLYAYTHKFVCDGFHIFPVSDCTGNTSADGFLPLKKEDYNVQFFHQDGKYAIKVSWQPPRGTYDPETLVVGRS
jgi:hypothetical protein